MKITKRLKGKVTIEATLTRNEIATAIEALQTMEDTCQDLYKDSSKKEHLVEMVQAVKLKRRLEAILKRFEN